MDTVEYGTEETEAKKGRILQECWLLRGSSALYLPSGFVFLERDCYNGNRL